MKQIYKLSRLCFLVLLCMSLSGCFFSNLINDDGYTHDSWLDTDTFQFSNKVEIARTKVSDTLDVNLKPERKEGYWIQILQGYIKRFAYDDGILLIEFYDKWYTINVKDYVAGTLDYKLEEYSKEAEVRLVYPKFDSLAWELGSFSRKEKELLDEYKTTKYFEWKLDDLID